MLQYMINETVTIKIILDLIRHFDGFTTDFWIRRSQQITNSYICIPLNLHLQPDLMGEHLTKTPGSLCNFMHF